MRPVAAFMPPLLDPDTVSRALAAAEPAAREALAAELAAVRERAARSGASAEQLRLAEALVLALKRPARVGQ
jgi:hypothetical protein